MTKWFIDSVTDVLIAFTLATLLLCVVAVNYPELFPQQFFHYWTVATPDAMSPAPSEAPRQVSVVTQVQR